MIGSDVAILNLRPVDTSRMLGRSGHLRVKAQSGIQQRIDRMSMERPRELPIDPHLSQLYKKNGIEKTLQAKPDMNIKTSEDLENVTRELSRFNKVGDSSLDDQNLNRNAVW